MMRRAAIALLALLILALLGLFWMARPSFQRESTQVPLPWSETALENSTLLLERWFSARGHAVRRSGGALLRHELPDRGLLMLMSLSHPLMDSEVELLREWVRGGGCLLVDSSAAPFNDARGTKALLDPLGVVLESDPGDEEDEAPGIRVESFLRDQAQYRIRTSSWHLRLGQPPVQTSVQTQTQTQAQAQAEGAGELWIPFFEGQGQILLLADTSFLRNASFADLDHAAWLARILQEAGATPRCPVVVWSKETELSLLPWMREHAWPFLLSCGVLLLAWVWAGLPRFGALLPSPTASRRSLLEHLEASGRFLWRHGGREALLGASRAAVLRKAARLHPAFPHLDEDERHALLAHHAGLPEEAVASALIVRPGLTAEEQAHYLQILQILRQRIPRTL